MTSSNIIKAENKTLLDLLDKNKYQVDPFQREYKWETEHIEELLVDLERAFKSNFDAEHTIIDASNYSIYYLGPIVLYEKNGANHLIDGQQRLTSLTLLLIYLNHLQRKVLDKEDWSDFESLIISKVLLTKTFNLEIEDRTIILKKIFDGKFNFIESDYISNDSCRYIMERYFDIEALFPPGLKHPDVLPLFIYWLQRKLYITEIRAFNDENAYTIFETMNDRGLQLTPSEMLKSYLLVKVKNSDKLEELNDLWKAKIVELRKFDRVEEDINFFKAWLRSKYAKRQDKDIDDFERIGNRFHYWVKDNDKEFGLNSEEDYYFFVKTHFQFYVDLYLLIRKSQFNAINPESVLRLSFFKGVSPSLSIPLILSPITVVDNEEMILGKINIVANYLDCYAIYRLLLNESITQSSINYTFNNLTIEIRNTNQNNLAVLLKGKNTELLQRFKKIDYLTIDKGSSKYLLSRIYKNYNPDIPFEDIYFQRKKDSFTLYQFLANSDLEPSVNKLPSNLKNLFMASLTSCCLIPKTHVPNYEKLTISNRINLLHRNGYLPESIFPFDLTNNLQQFFIDRNKALKSEVQKIWTI